MAEHATPSHGELAFGKTPSGTYAVLATDANGAMLAGSQAYGGTPLAVTRPANTTAYVAGKVVGGPQEFTNMGPSGGNILITSTQLMIDDVAILSGETSYRLHLYNVSPPSALADNAVWDLPSGDRAAYLGYVDLGAPADVGSTLYVESNGLNKQVLLAGTSLFGYLVTNGAYTPSASRVYLPTLHAVSL